MKIFHISDLHIGKTLKERSLIEDQKYILDKIIEKINEYKPNALIIAGDIYDTSNPSVEAVGLFDYFITELAKTNTVVFIIAGNHDQAGRLAFAKDILKNNNIYISSVFKYPIDCITLNEDNLEVDFYMLPFSRMRDIKKYFENEQIDSYSDAFKYALSSIDDDRIKIIMAHQFLRGGSCTDSEMPTSVGGQDEISTEPFQKFDYVALGHLHRPQNVGSEKIRYSGSPLKYSFSEVNDKKSITCIDILSKKDIKVSNINLIPKTDMIDIRGKFDDLIEKSYIDSVDNKAYIRITLSDENIIYDAINRLREYYPNLLELTYENKYNPVIDDDNEIDIQDIEQSTPAEIITRYYENKQGSVLTDEQNALINSIIEEVWGENK